MKKILGKIIAICIIINLILIAISISIQANVEDGIFTNKEIPYAITAKKVDCYGSSLFLDDQGRVWDTTLHSGMQYSDCLTQLFKDSGLVFKDIAAGSGFIILLDEDGYMYTSGKNDFYQLGNGNRSTTATTELVAIGGTRTFSKVFANKQTGYAITSDGKLYAWGDNFYGQATTSNITFTEVVTANGTNQTTASNTRPCQSIPTQILTDYRFESLSANNDSVIAITTDKKAIAWGVNDNNCINPTTEYHNILHWYDVGRYALYTTPTNYEYIKYIDPTLVSETMRFKKVSVGGNHSIFLTTNNMAYTIGSNSYGETGTNHNNTQLEQPIGLEDTEVLDILAGNYISGFIDSNHIVWMCGRNNSKQLGNSTGTDSSTIARVRVTGLSTDRFAVGDTTSTVLVYDTSGNVWGWGYYHGLGYHLSNQDPIQITGIRPQATITFDSQGATTTGTESITASYGYAMPSITLPQKTGYTFNGYFTSTNGSGIKYYNANGTSARNWDSSYDTTLYAYWIVSNYTIEYNLNGGSLASGASNPTTGTVGSYVYISNVPTKTGYTFAGWSSSTSAGLGANAKTGTTSSPTTSWNGSTTNNKYYKDLRSEAGTVTLTANWTANTYTIAYSLNNGALVSGASNPTSGTYDQDVNIANEPSKTGYTFTGWTTSSSAGLGTTAKTGTAANPSTAWTGSLTKNKYFKNLRETSGTVTLTANYSENTYTIAFNNNTGTGSMNSLTGVKYTESKTLTSNTFTKTGYTFKGWATSASGAVAYNNGASVSKLSSTNGATVTLYAVWQKDTYTITYNLDGGTNSSSNPSSYQVDTATITLQAPTKKGYTFKGWTGSNGTTAQTSVSIPTGSTGNKTFNANWTKDTYTITYTLNGGTNHSSNPSSYQVDTATINLQPPTRTGYTFAGWTGSNGNTAQTAVAITTGSTGNKSYVANWGTNTYTIAYSLNGGALASGKTNPTNGTFDSDLNIANEPAKEGYTFTGWTTSSSAGLGTNAKTGTAANPSTAWTGSLTKNKYFKNLRDTSGTVTLTANYSENTYTIAFNNNGGIGTMTSLSGVKYTESKTLTSNTFTKSGYTFKGWATSASGAKVYDDGASVSKLSATNNATVTLYAVWQKDTYTISYTLNGGTNNASNPSTYQVDSAAINLQQPTKTGYTFAGWTGSNGTTAQTSVTIVTGSTGNKSYTANWAANTYTISYNLSNGALEQGKTNPTSGTYDQDVNIANEPVKAGYTFTGWTTSSSAGLGTNAKTGTAANPSTAWTGSLTKNKYFKNLRDTSGTVTLTANFSANTNTKYTIKYFMQGFDTEIVSYEEDESLREEKQGTTDTTAQVQTADIKDVTGFTYDETNSRNKLSGTVTADGNLVLELYYKRNSYTITYEPNGGTMAGTTGRYYYGKRYTLNSNVVRPGNTFMGWYDNSQFNGNTISYIEANETGNKTFYAKWSKEAYTITYTLNGGINANSNPANYDVETNTITLAQPTKVGYTFTGWTGSNGNTPSLNVTIPKGSTGNKSYTANWRANTYTIAYNLNGGELEQGKTNPTSGTYDQDVNIANEPVMLGYTFTGWTTNASSGLESTAKTGASENPNTSWNGTLVNNKYFKNLRNTEGVVTLTANFDANTNTKYTVKYFLQNFDTEIENYEEDESLRDEKQGTTNEQIQLTEDDINEVEGFTYDNANSRNKITGTVAADGSLILEVYFRRNIYSIRYETNGGTMPSTTNRYYYGRRFVLSQNIRKDSNVFLGWYDNSELNGNAVTYVEAGETGDKTFYAKWGEANNLYVEAMNNQCVVEDNMISKIGPNTKLSDLSNKITTNGNVVVKNKKGVQIGNNDLIGTGYTITISMNGQEKTYEASILGDIDGNGKTSMVDIVKANQGMLGKINLTNAQKKAADTSGDNRLTLLDIVRMNQAYLGKISL